MGRKIKLKICGMRDPVNIAAVSALSPDYMGFIDYPASPRYIGSNFSAGRIPVAANTVGVFVNEMTEKISARVSRNNWKYVQLHGTETPDQCEELRSLGLKVIKVFPVDDHFDFGQTQKFVPVVDYFLFDTKGRLYGGNASQFNWTILEKYNQVLPFFLSGGLHAGNLKDLYRLKDMNLYAVDLNSGVEHSPGLKDLNKIREVIDLLENA